MSTILTSRSALEAVGVCHRYRFLAYDFARGAPLENGLVHIGGISPSRRSIYFHTGGTVHEMVAQLLQGRSLEAAIKTGHDYYWNVVSSLGIDPEDDSAPPSSQPLEAIGQVPQIPVLIGEELPLSPEEMALYGDPAQSEKALQGEFNRRRNQWIAKEQWALAEGLVRAWDLKQRRRMLERYEVVEVEREGSFLLNPREGWGGTNRPQIVFQFRPDALLRDKLDGQLYVWSLKTKGMWRGKLDEDQARVDVQGLSEAVGLEQAWLTETGRPVECVVCKLRKKPWGRSASGVMANSLCGPDCEGYALDPKPGELWPSESRESFGFNVPKVHGIQMHYLLKGQRKFDDRIGWKVTYNPLLRGWRNVQQGIVEDSTSWAWSWNIPDKSGKNKSGKSTLNYRSWTPFYSWEDYPGGVAEWFQALSTGKIQPEAIELWGDPIDGLFIEPPPYYRQPRDMESWLRQARAQETRLAESHARYEQAIGAHGWGSQEVEEVLDEEYPQTRRNCVTWRRCGMYDICHGPATVRENPTGNGFILRQNHHEALED